jgi:hypothetical protein
MSLTDAPSPFDTVLDFLANAPTPDDILAYRPPEVLQARMSELLARNGEGVLTDPERAELDELLHLNRLMSRLKAHVRQKFSMSRKFSKEQLCYNHD